MSSSLKRFAININLITNLSIFSVPALALVIPSGYSYGAAILALISIVHLILSKKTESKLRTTDKLLCIALIVYFLTFFITAYHDGFSIRELERPSRFLFASLILIFLIHRKVRPDWLLYGIIAGAIGAGAISLYQYFILDIGRPSGHHHTIAFGNDSLMLALLTLCCLWHFIAKNKTSAIMLCLAGFTLGVSAFIFSATRGGWAATPIALFILWQYRKVINKKIIFIMVLILASIAAFITYNPSLSSFNRLQLAHNHFLSYLDGNAKNSSTGIRIEMWRSGWLSFKEDPLLGTGVQANKEDKKVQINAGLVHPNIIIFEHFHNEFITAAVYRGIPGLIGLLAIYMLPALFFIAKLRSLPANEKIYPLSGAVVCLSYMAFGMTQSMLEHNSGAVLYPSLVVFFWAAIRTLPSTNEKQ